MAMTKRSINCIVLIFVIALFGGCMVDQCDIQGTWSASSGIASIMWKISGDQYEYTTYGSAGQTFESGRFEQSGCEEGGKHEIVTYEHYDNVGYSWHTVNEGRGLRHEYQRGFDLLGGDWIRVSSSGKDLELFIPILSPFMGFDDRYFRR
jgi:hypothetical protein